MKKIGIVLTVVFTLAAGAAFAQSNMQKGLKVGVGMANFNGNQVTGASSQTSFTIGAFTSFKMSESFALQPEVNYLEEGASGDLTIFSQNTYSSVKLSYLQIPVLAKFMLSTSSGFTPSIYAGPSFSVLLGHKFETSSSTNNIFENPTVNEVTGGAVVGVGADISNIMLDVRYNYDFTDAFRLSNATNGAISITLGYAF
ncbi:MAG TPA: porin family protein [Balneolales bacterium]|nr:porin family protein [Balneolales bacterium]